MSIGANIRHYRKQAGFSAKELGEKIGVTAQCICQIERGERNINSTKTTAIADVLNISEQDLFTELPLTLGEKIAQARKDKGLTQSELAELIGKTESLIRKYEKNLVHDIPHRTRVRLSEVLGVVLYEEIDFKDYIQSKNKLIIHTDLMTISQLKETILKCTEELAKRVGD